MNGNGMFLPQAVSSVNGMTGDVIVPGSSGGTPAITLGTTNTAGSSPNFLRRDDTILAFDATAPSTQAYGDTASVGVATVAARRDHKHAMPAAFNGGTVTTGITAPAFTLSATPTRSLDQRILRTVSPGLNPVAGTTYDLFKFNLGDLRGFFTVTLLVNGSGYGQSMEFVLPATYAMDWLQQGYGYTSGNNPFNAAAWVTLTPTVFSGRHLMTSATTLNLQAQVQANDLYFRLWLKDALTGTPTFLLSIQHDQGIENTTVTTYTTTGSEAGPFPTLPNYISSKGGVTSVYNSLGINTAAPAYPLDVNGQAIFRDRVGFYGTTPQSKWTVNGSRGGNAALTSLLQALAGLGLITDGTTA